MVEEDVEGHSLFSVSSQQAEQEVLEFWRRPNGKPERRSRLAERWRIGKAKLTLVPNWRFSRRSSSTLGVCELGMEPFLSSTGTRWFPVTRDLKES